MNDRNLYFPGELGQEEPFLNRRITAADDKDFFIRVVGGITGGTEGNAFVIQEIIFVLRPG